MNQDTLREFQPFEDDDGVNVTNLWEHCRKHAAAWEAREKLAEEYVKGADATILDLRKRLEEAACPDVQTAHALADMIKRNQVRSPWRDGGVRLLRLGEWLAALAAGESGREPDEGPLVVDGIRRL